MVYGWLVVGSSSSVRGKLRRGIRALVVPQVVLVQIAQPPGTSKKDKYELTRGTRGDGRYCEEAAGLC